LGPAQSYMPLCADTGPAYDVHLLRGPFDHLLTSAGGPSSLVDSDPFQLPPRLLSATLHNSVSAMSPSHTSLNGSSASFTSPAFRLPALVHRPSHMPLLPTASYPDPIHPSQTLAIPLGMPFFSLPTSRSRGYCPIQSAPISKVGLGIDPRRLKGGSEGGPSRGSAGIDLGLPSLGSAIVNANLVSTS
jgi:hypothetical protein